MVTAMPMSVRDSYDARSREYAELFLGELNRDAQSLRWLDAFATSALARTRPVLDVGCGPGSAVAHLRELGVDAIGCDLSAGQIAEARSAFAGLPFHIGDLTALPHPDGSLGGIVSRYSIIHLPPDEHQAAFVEWHRALAPGAPVFVSFFGSRSATAHGTPFDHAVTTAYEFWPATVGELLDRVGFTDIQIEATPIPEGGRPFDHTTVFGTRGG